MRHIAEGDLAAFCSWLDVELDGRAEVLSSSFPAQTLHADLLVRLGRGRLLHVEYMRDAEPDLSVRMAGYRFRIMEKHPGNGVQQDALLEATAVLATIRLDVLTIDRIRRETGMTVESIADFYSETEVGRELLNRGNQQGIEQGVVATLTRLLRAKFGDQPGIETAAKSLAHWTDQDAVVLAITQAGDLSAIPAEESSGR